jgi:predicted nucleic acid-binding protein
MSYLIDTNVISELKKPAPSAKVIAWLDNIPSESLYLSVLTIGEIRKGAEKHPDKKRKESIRLWLEYDLLSWFEGRILPIDLHVADRWGRLLNEINRTISAVDSLIAATALHYDLRIVTRNEADFQFPTLQVVNPWD